MTNTLFFGDNLDVLRNYIEDETVDLIYLDPPFNSNATYNILYKSPVGADAQIKAFADTWRWEDGASKALDDLSRSDVATFNMLRAFQTFLGYSDVMAYLAMMAVRLVELRRVLKPTGSLYLHCDPTASHYLKMLLDAIFSADGGAFRSEVIWKRTGTHSSAKRWGPVHDVIFFYTKSSHYTWNRPYAPLEEHHRARHYRHVDEQGRRFTHGELTAPGKRNGRSGAIWKGFDVSAIGRHWMTTVEKLDELNNQGRIYLPGNGGWPRLVRYEDEGSGGRAMGDTWIDISPINMQARERLGYPTQKPIALLERIVSASSKPGDVVLDPFCGCGTAIHAAENLKRHWVGIDITYLAIQVIEDRLKTWLPRAKYKLSGIPSDELSARKLAAQDPHTFQQWAVARVGGQSRGKGADKGIDGEIAFQTGSRDYGRGIVSVKAGKHVGPEPIRSLRAVVDREGADVGIFICLEQPTREMKSEAHAAGRVHLPGGDRPRIQIVTAAELIRGPDLGILTALNTIGAAQEARRITQRKPGKRPAPEQLHREPELSPMGLNPPKKARKQPVAASVSRPEIEEKQASKKRA